MASAYVPHLWVSNSTRHAWTLSVSHTSPVSSTNTATFDACYKHYATPPYDFLAHHPMRYRINTMLFPHYTPPLQRQCGWNLRAQAAPRSDPRSENSRSSLCLPDELKSPESIRGPHRCGNCSTKTRKVAVEQSKLVVRSRRTASHHNGDQ